MNINDRLKMLIEALGLNNNLFAKQIGVNPVVTHNIISGRRTKPSLDVLEKILLSFDNINAVWLVCGKGPMWVDAATHPTAQATPPPQTTTELLLEQLQEAQRINRDLLDVVKNLSAVAKKE